MNPLHDDELDRALECWQVPDPPPRLEAKAMDACRSGFRRASRWKNLLTLRVSVPLPAAAAVVIALTGMLVMLARVELRSVPADRSRMAVSRDSPKAAWDGLKPVAELRPRIIRGEDEDR